MKTPTRRQLLQLPLATALASAATSPKKRNIDEYAPGNIKLSHRVEANMSDDDLLFLKQIGMRWARVEFQRGRSPFEFIQKTPAAIRRLRDSDLLWRSLRLSDAGTCSSDAPGATRKSRSTGPSCAISASLAFPVANYDFHPANTYTTADVDSPRGYTAREFKLADFRSKVEKQAFEREYSADDIWDFYTYFMKAVSAGGRERRSQAGLCIRTTRPSPR